MATYRIESRLSSFFRWRAVTPRPHGECYPFDNLGLLFTDETEVVKACNQFRKWNEGEFRIIEDDGSGIMKLYNG